MHLHEHNTVRLVTSSPAAIQRTGNQGDNCKMVVLLVYDWLKDNWKFSKPMILSKTLNVHEGIFQKAQLCKLIPN